MTSTTFDPLDYFEKLKAAGFTEMQTKVQAEAQRQHAEAQRAALQAALDRYDEASRREITTKGDLRETELLLQSEIRATELRLQGEIRATELRLLKWQIGIMLTGFGGLVAIMAKGFGWLGF